MDKQTCAPAPQAPSPLTPFPHPAPGVRRNMRRDGGGMRLITFYCLFLAQREHLSVRPLSSSVKVEASSARACCRVCVYAAQEPQTFGRQYNT
eukprot:scaffold29453_cov96-Isochrysis_galbana.AAC.5